MTPTETAAILRQFNEWRRGDYEPSEQPEPPNPYEVGLAIDAAVEMIERLEAAEKEREEFKRACFGHISDNSLLRAKIEQMERQEPVEWQSRTRPTWNDGTWTQWSKCSEGYAKDIMKSSLVQDWIYEARPLYALPGAQGEGK